MNAATAVSRPKFCRKIGSKLNKRGISIILHASREAVLLVAFRDEGPYWNRG